MALDAHGQLKSGKSPIGEQGEGESVTQLLARARDGSDDAMEQLIPLVYDELRAIAHRQLRAERSQHTLSTTALVHEAYLRLVDQQHVEWQDRAHFFAVGARVMRRVLVDYARRRAAKKRDGVRKAVSLDEALLVVDDQADMLLDLDEALTRLAAHNGRMARVVELRFFAGLTEDEAAEVLGVSPRTVRYDWIKAKGWLYRELTDAMHA
jgi:RNA polymerase sigma factor (TIGR02999 family)